MTACARWFWPRGARASAPVAIWAGCARSSRPSPRRASARPRKLAMMLQALNTLPKPLIGRVHGNAFGGGVGLASVCDVAIGADTCRWR